LRVEGRDARRRRRAGPLDSWRGPRHGARRRRSRCGPKAEDLTEPARSAELRRRPRADDRHRRADDEQRRRASAVRIGGRRTGPGSEARAAGDRQLLLAHGIETRGDRPRRSVRVAGAHARHSGPNGARYRGPVMLSTPLQYLKGVGPRRAADFARVGLVTVEDLLYRFPIRYEDRSRLQPIASLRPGQTAAIAGRVSSCGVRATRRPGFKIFEALITDGTGSVRATWLDQPFLRDVLVRGHWVVPFGPAATRGSGGMRLPNPQHEFLDDEA